MSGLSIGMGPAVVNVKHRPSVGQLLLEAMPPVKGNWLMGTILLRLLPAKWSKTELEVAGDTWRAGMELDLRDPAQFSMVKNGRFDSMTAALIGKLLRPGDTYVDVGANWGYFACIAATAVGGPGVVVACEPNRTAYAQLVRTIERHGLWNVIPLPYAVSDREGERVTLVRPFYRQTTSSYIESGGGGSDMERTILTTTLDSMLAKIRTRRIGLVKVDTEGAELLVVRGAQGILKEWKPPCVLEVSAYCARFGYTVGDLYDMMRALEYSQAYRIVDEDEQPHLVGPLTEDIEGQILFCHDARGAAGVP